jgi:arsenite transporter
MSFSMIPTVHRILYATDLSESARQAMVWALNLATTYQASLAVLHVMPDLVEEMAEQMGYDLAAHFGAEHLDSFNNQGRQSAEQRVRDRIGSVLLEVQAELKLGRGPDTDIIIKVGRPVREILATVQEGEYDLVVMGTHGHGFIDELLIGSVARAVVQRSPKPVLTIRLP